MSVEANYLRDLGQFIKEAAFEAKHSADAAEKTEAKAFQQGRRMAYYEVVSLMQEQAVAFRLSLASIGLDDVDPDRQLI